MTKKAKKKNHPHKHIYLDLNKAQPDTVSGDRPPTNSLFDSNIFYTFFFFSFFTRFYYTNDSVADSVDSD